MFEITAITKGGSIYLRYYDSPMPNKFDFYILDFFDSKKYEFAKSCWQQSVKEVQVHESSREEIEYEMRITYRQQKLEGFYSQAAKRGIPCDFLKDRIEIKKFAEFQDGDYYHFSCNECGVAYIGYKRQLICEECCNTEYAHLKPLDLPITKHITDLAMKEVSKDVRSPKCVRDGLVLPIEERQEETNNEGDIYWIFHKAQKTDFLIFLEQIKSNFTITRNK